MVSVIIPVYNAEKFIFETLVNVLKQEETDIEVIVVNDGSTDHSDIIIKNFISDPRVRYISQSNMGCSGAKNTGLQMAEGDFIQFLDADDMLSADKIKAQVEQLKNDPMAVSVCRTRSFYNSPDDKTGYEIDTEFLYSTDNSFEFVLNLYGLKGKKGMIQPNAFLISRQLADQIGPYNMAVSPSPDEDGEYFCRAMLAADKIIFSEKGINYYRRPTDPAHNLSRQVSHRHATGALKSLQLIGQHLLHRENSARVKNIMASYYANFIYLYSRYGDLCRQASAEIKQLGIREIPAAGGAGFTKLVKWIGFQNALRIKNLKSRVTGH